MRNPYASDEWRAIIRHMRTDDSDLARLVAADWLQENDREEYATVVRHAVENPVGEVRFSEGMGARLSAGRPGLAMVAECTLAERIPNTRFRADRGFVTRVDTTMGQWVIHGPRLCQRHPIKKVEITNRIPGRIGVVSCVWIRQIWAEPLDLTSWVPGPIFDRLIGAFRQVTGGNSDRRSYESTDSAVRDLHRAALAWAEEVADDPYDPYWRTERADGA